MNMCANKHDHIRSALVYNEEIAKLSREHNNANVICIGSRFMTQDQAKQCVDVFLNTEFSKEERHRTRAQKIQIQ